MLLLRTVTGAEMRAGEGSKHEAGEDKSQSIQAVVEGLYPGKAL